MMNKIFSILMLLCSAAFLASCAKSSGSSTPSTAYGVCTQAGYIQTQYGCAPQTSSCGVNYGYINGGCYPAVTNGASTCGTAGYVQTTMGCLPQSTMCGTNYTQYGYANGQCYPATSNGINNGVGGVGGTCQAGYVGTAQGCLPQGSCPVNYGYYYGVYNGQTGGWCYPRTY